MKRRQKLTSLAKIVGQREDKKAKKAQDDVDNEAEKALSNSDVSGYRPRESQVFTRCVVCKTDQHTGFFSHPTMIALLCGGAEMLRRIQLDVHERRQKA